MTNSLLLPFRNQEYLAIIEIKKSERRRSLPPFELKNWLKFYPTSHQHDRQHLGDRPANPTQLGF